MPKTSLLNIEKKKQLFAGLPMNVQRALACDLKFSELAAGRLVP
jgi:hypothetical protein